MERKNTTTSEFSDKSWLLQFCCPSVEVMFAILMCHGWGKPMKHEVQWVNAH